MDARESIPPQLRRGLDLAVMLISWRIWKEHNARVFDDSSSTALQVARAVL
jgi:hypothetical protein